MNNNPQTILSDQQRRLVAELVDTYGIEPGEVTFFPEDPKPFLSYEATCTVLNQLIDLQDINIIPIDTPFQDSLSLKCEITLPNGWKRSAVGVVNLKEQIDGRDMSPQQLYQTASARAIRNALKTAGIDLINLHQTRDTDADEFTGPNKTNRASLLGQVHVLGKEAGLIDGSSDKPAWRSFLRSRYGVESSGSLSEPHLADLVAILRAIGPGKAAA